MADALCNYFKHLLRKNLTEIIAKTHAIALKGNMGSSQIQVRTKMVFSCTFICLCHSFSHFPLKHSLTCAHLLFGCLISLYLSAFISLPPPTHTHTHTRSPSLTHTLSLSHSHKLLSLTHTSSSLSLSLSLSLRTSLW